MTPDDTAALVADIRPRLSEAVEHKLAEQRKFVLWWDAQEKDKGGGDVRNTRNRPATGVIAGQNGLPDRETIHRWRARLKTEPKYQRALEAAQRKCVLICEARKGATDQRGASGTNDNEWYTPKAYVEAARAVLGAIDLDPATSAHAQRWIKATRFFTKQQDGLAQEWPGRVWLNPPYMQPDIANFVAKLVAEVTAQRTTAAILLTHNYTDTAWFHQAIGACAAVCFTRGRVAFVDVEGTAAAPTQGQAFTYFGSIRCARIYPRILIVRLRSGAGRMIRTTGLGGGRGRQLLCGCHPDLSYLYFPEFSHIAPSDVDGLNVVEHRGQLYFLYVEHKRPTERLSVGQQYLLEAVSSLPRTQVLLVRGSNGSKMAPSSYQKVTRGLWGPTTRTNAEDMRARVKAWLLLVRSQG